MCDKIRMRGVQLFQHYSTDSQTASRSGFRAERMLCSQVRSIVKYAESYRSDLLFLHFDLSKESTKEGLNLLYLESL